VVEVGRVALINYGPLAGKSCVILDVIDQSKALVDGPQALTGVKRQMIPFTRLSLTKVKLSIPRSIGVSALTKAYTEQKINAALDTVSWVKKAARNARRRALGDFDRFNLMLLKKKRSLIVGQAFAKLRRAHNKGKDEAKKKAKGAAGEHKEAEAVAE